MLAKRSMRERILGLPRAVWRRVLHRWALLRARRLSIARVDAQQPRRLLVMCYGNIYRSPFVAAWLGARLAERSGFEIRSAGFHLVAARPSPQEYIRLAGDYRVDLEPHRSRIVEPADLEWADAIVIMDRYNWERLQGFGAGVQDKVIWLGAFAPDGAMEIDDPYAMPLPRVQAIIEQMRDAADGLAHRLLGGGVRR
jgi:protein-tyrosine phosphatase